MGLPIFHVLPTDIHAPDARIVKDILFRDMKNICITTTEAFLPRFFKLLAQGFIVTTQAGCSIKDLLCEQLGIDEDYLDNRIQTLFLDGQPVDDVSKAYLQNEATLALSAAMPGLVGATFRKGGAYAAMRNTISYNAESSDQGLGEARIKLKLFNMVLKELGPVFLQNGVSIRMDKFKEFLSGNIADLKISATSIQLNDQKIDIDTLAELDLKGSGLNLQVRIE